MSGGIHPKNIAYKPMNHVEIPYGYVQINPGFGENTLWHFLCVQIDQWAWTHFDQIKTIKTHTATKSHISLLIWTVFPERFWVVCQEENTSLPDAIEEFWDQTIIFWLPVETEAAAVPLANYSCVFS